MEEIFRKFAKHVSNLVGSPITFMVAMMILAGWGISGYFVGFSNTWQLVINTATTIVTFLMVFLIQNTQNRDAKAIHLKLDELIRSLRTARNSLIDLEEMFDDELDKLHDEFVKVREKKRTRHLSNPHLEHHNHN